MFTLACKDMGMECDFVAEGATKEEALQKSEEHALDVHAMTEDNFTPELREKAASMVKESI